MQHEINRVLAKAARRLWLGRFINLAVLLLSAALLAAIALRLVQQIVGIHVNWWWAVYAVPPAVIIFAALGAYWMRPDKIAIARKVDEGADLRESLSTALIVERDREQVDQAPRFDQAWGENVIETARSAANRVVMKDAVPVSVDRRWPAVIALGLSLVVVWVTVPAVDVLGLLAKRSSEQAKEEDLKAAKMQAQESVAKAQAKANEALAKLTDEKAAEDAKPPTDPQAATTPEQAKQQAVQQLTTLRQKLEQAKLSERAQTAQMMADKMKQLRSPGPGELNEFARALAQGKMAEASTALQNLGQKMASGNMTEAQKEQLSQALSNLQKQLEKVGEDKKQLEQALAKAGLDPKLAESAEKLADALKNNQQLSEQAKQALQNMAEAQKNAEGACQNMAQAMGQMAQAMQQQSQSGQQGQQGQQGDQGNQGDKGQQAAQAMQDLQNAMNQMEMAQSDMNSLQAAMSEAQAQLDQMAQGAGQCEAPGQGEAQGDGQGAGQGQGGDGTGQFSEGATNQNGGGTGGPGQSDGGPGVGEQADIERWKDRKVRTALGDGPMIGTMLIQGEQIKGESRQQMAELLAKAEQQATEAMNTNQIPRELQGTVKNYFSTVNKPAASTPAPTPAPAPAPAPSK